MSLGSAFGSGGQPGQPGTSGAPGDAATITVGNVTTGLPGSSAAVTNVGTTSAAVLNFAIPQGDTGAPGTNGNTILTTLGAPSNAFGVDGNYAYDPTAKLMYGPKAGGVWPDGTLLGSAHLAQYSAADITTSSALESTLVTGTFVPITTSVTYCASGTCTLSAQQNLNAYIEVLLGATVIRRVRAVTHYHTVGSALIGSFAWAPFYLSGLTVGATYTIRIQWQASSGTRTLSSGNFDAAHVNVRAE